MILKSYAGFVSYPSFFLSISWGKVAKHKAKTRIP
jgi:hypothetical protein